MNIIRKHNDLIETSYQLGAREQFFILFLISQISYEETEFPQYRLPFSNLMQFMNFDGQKRLANINELYKMMDNLNTSPIKFMDGAEDVKLAWITELRYNRETKDVTFTLNPNLKKYLLNLKGFFTKYNIDNIPYLSVHSVRLYELLKRHEFKAQQSVVFTLEDLKFYLGLANKYPKFYEFKRWVLESAQEELETYTDIRFNYAEHDKDGKRIVSLKFDFFQNEPKIRPVSLAILDKMAIQQNHKITRSVMKQLSHNLQMPSLPLSSEARQAELTWTKHHAFDFLAQKGVNTAFILNKVLAHPKLNYEILTGFEDVYIQILWQFLETKSTVKEKAGAFVSWWKNERFTKDTAHARFVEAVANRQKMMNVADVSVRRSTKTLTKTAFEDFSKHHPTTKVGEYDPSVQTVEKPAKRVGEQSISGVLSPIKTSFQKPEMFNIEHFKEQYPQLYAQFLDKAVADFERFYTELKQPFVRSKCENQIVERAKQSAKDWVQAKVS
jgi:plasmid replication initiation protein